MENRLEKVGATLGKYFNTSTIISLHRFRGIGSNGQYPIRINNQEALTIVSSNYQGRRIVPNNKSLSYSQKGEIDKYFVRDNNY